MCKCRNEMAPRRYGGNVIKSNCTIFLCEVTRKPLYKANLAIEKLFRNKLCFEALIINNGKVRVRHIYIFRSSHLNYVFGGFFGFELIVLLIIVVNRLKVPGLLSPLAPIDFCVSTFDNSLELVLLAGVPVASRGLVLCGIGVFSAEVSGILDFPCALVALSVDKREVVESRGLLGCHIDAGSDSVESPI
jgi:hypothetical protein